MPHITSFRDYWERLTIDERKAFARRCQASYFHFRNYAKGEKKKIDARFVVNMERESDRRIRCELERPDVDWNTIRGTPKSRLRAPPPKPRRARA